MSNSALVWLIIGLANCVYYTSIGAVYGHAEAAWQGG